MQETGVQSLGQEDLLEEEMATHSSILSWKTPWTESLAACSPWSCKESDTTERLSTHTHTCVYIYICIHMYMCVYIYLLSHLAVQNKLT